MGAAAFRAGERRMGDHQTDERGIGRFRMAFGERVQGRDGGAQAGLIARDAEMLRENGTNG